MNAPCSHLLEPIDTGTGDWMAAAGEKRNQYQCVKCGQCFGKTAPGQRLRACRAAVLQAIRNIADREAMTLAETPVDTHGMRRETGWTRKP